MIPNRPSRPLVSFVLATHNRRAVVGHTLSQLRACGLERDAYEVIVVDNASTDGTVEDLPAKSDVLVRLERNRGSCAKAVGVSRAKGNYIVFLDDDSFPRPGAVTRMVAHFEADRKLGAAGFAVHLPDGSQEGGALPDVFLGCGVGFRAEALKACGGLDLSFFMQAEEYDLAFRMAMSGWGVRVFDDLHVDHFKTPCARRSERTTFYDIRNNLRVIGRFVPLRCHDAYRQDCMQRYRWLADVDGHGASFARGLSAGRLQGISERRTHRRFRLSRDVFERFFRWEELTRHMIALRREGMRRILFADLGKNVFAYHRAAIEAGLAVAAIGDDRFSLPGRRYRGLSIVRWEVAANMDVDGIVVANSSPVHGTATWERIASAVAMPVYHWFRQEGKIHTSPSADVGGGSRTAIVEAVATP